MLVAPPVPQDLDRVDSFHHKRIIMKLLVSCLIIIVVLTFHAASCFVQAFTSTPHRWSTSGRTMARPDVVRRPPLAAGGFEWEDPAEAFDQGVENPYKKASLMEGEGGLKIDPARLLSPRLSGANLYLVGMMGSGKSAVGKIVAKRMGSYTFLDTDEIIEKAVGMTIPEIFASEGEDTFREVEAQVLDSVHPYVRCVISTGGGIVCRRENWSKLHTGVVVWLDVAPEIIHNRIQGTDRPLLQTDDPLQTLKDLLNARQEQYGNADVRIEISSTMNENDVADMVIRELHHFIDLNPPAWKIAKQKAQAEGLDWVK